MFEKELVARKPGPSHFKAILELRRYAQPFYSIILPTYNRAYCLEEAIRSVQQQTFRNWELLVVDDGSDDDTVEIVGRLQEDDDRISLLMQTRRGPALARNFGIQCARGEYVTFIDSDDKYLPDHLEIRRKILAKDPALDFLFGGMEIIGSPWVPDRANHESYVRLDEGWIGAAGTFVLRRHAALALGGFPNVPYSEDGMLLDRARESGLNILKVLEPTYLYNRESPDSICNQIAGHPPVGHKRQI